MYQKNQTKVYSANKKYKRHPLANTWYSMKQRCYNKNNPNYKNYGARGIYICDEWLNDFNQFVKDMGSKPDGTTLDRVDNDGPYSPNNCRWADSKTQNNNSRNNVPIKGILWWKTRQRWRVGSKTYKTYEEAILALNHV